MTKDHNPVLNDAMRPDIDLENEVQSTSYQLLQSSEKAANMSGLSGRPSSLEEDAY